MNAPAFEARRPVVLVVDDEAANRQIVCDALDASGYEVMEMDGGRAALDLLEERDVDVVVLDVKMPDVDGLEVCRVVRQNPKTASLPVILVTAHHGRRERLSGIEAGASDFLRKPVDLTDLTLRVRNAVASKRLHDQALRDYERVLELESLRDDLVHMIAHDLRSPLSSMRTSLELVEFDAQGVLPDESLALIRDAIEATTVFTDMVTKMLDVSRLEAGELPVNAAEHDLGDIACRALAMLGEAGSKVRVDVPATPVRITCDGDMVRRVIVNIVANALDFSPAPMSVTLTVARADEGRVRFACTDRGPGIPVEAQDKIFDKFGQVDGANEHRTSSGLGLTFCKLAVEAHGGAIGVHSVIGEGATFWVELPVAGPVAEMRDEVVESSGEDDEGTREASERGVLHPAGADPVPVS